jgi:hypothetical protein
VTSIRHTGMGTTSSTRTRSFGHETIESTPESGIVICRPAGVRSNADGAGRPRAEPDLRRTCPQTIPSQGRHAKTSVAMRAGQWGAEAKHSGGASLAGAYASTNVRWSTDGQPIRPSVIGLLRRDLDVHDECCHMAGAYRARPSDRLNRRRGERLEPRASPNADVRPTVRPVMARSSWRVPAEMLTPLGLERTGFRSATSPC